MGEIGVGHAGRVQEGQRHERHGRREGKVVRVHDLAPPDDKKNSAEDGITEAGEVKISGNVDCRGWTSGRAAAARLGLVALNQAMHGTVVLKPQLEMEHNTLLAPKLNCGVITMS